MHKLFTVVLILLFASPVPAPLVHAQSVVCPPPVEPSSDVLRVIIGHFGEGSREIEDFCRYLGSQSIMATFLSLGSITDARTAQRAQAALEASTIDALWINSAQLVRLLRESPLVAKIIGVTDFVVVHVVVRDPRLKAAVRLSFHPREAIVAPGRSGYFADALFTALGLAIRCLDVTINCRIAAGEGHYKTFLEDRQGRAAIVAAPTFRRETRDALALVLAQVTAQSRLVAIPLETVARMRPVPGMMAAVSIPRGYYALGARSDVPPEDV